MLQLAEVFAGNSTVEEIDTKYRALKAAASTKASLHINGDIQTSLASTFATNAFRFNIDHKV